MEISISTVIVSKYVYSAVISTISLDRLLLMQPILLMIGANVPAGSDDQIGRITTVPSQQTAKLFPGRDSMKVSPPRKESAGLVTLLP
jgi:hypothetical protein